MDRFSRSIALSACGFGLLLTVAGCRMTRPEVPPGRPYSSDGRQRPAIGFSSEPHPADGSAMTQIIPDSPGGSKLGAGARAGRPEPSPLLGGGSAQFGPPGTSGRDESVGGENSATIGRTTSASDEAVLPAGLPDDLSPPSIDPNPRPASDPATAPSPPDAQPQPQPDPQTPTSQVIGRDPNLSAGRMGRTNDFPSPN